MRKKVLRVGLSLFVGIVLFAVGVKLQAQEKSGSQPEAGGEAVSKKEFPWDKGPATIDVSKYPAQQQQNYKVFATKCSKCHTLARPINAPLALPEEWDAYVKKMQKKKRSGLDPASAKKLTDFLNYDSSVRKKNLIEKKLKEKISAE